MSFAFSMDLKAWEDMMRPAYEAANWFYLGSVTSPDSKAFLDVVHSTPINLKLFRTIDEARASKMTELSGIFQPSIIIPEEKLQTHAGIVYAAFDFNMYTAIPPDAQGLIMNIVYWSQEVRESGISFSGAFLRQSSAPGAGSAFTATPRVRVSTAPQAQSVSKVYNSTQWPPGRGPPPRK